MPGRVERAPVDGSNDLALLGKETRIAVLLHSVNQVSP
jgi:hypothetical protein